MPNMPASDAAAADLTAPDIAETFTAGGWEFTGAVAEEFDGHVRASVPFYDDIQALIAETADWLLPEGGLLADLGCSTGNTALAVLARQPERSLRVALYDSSTAMLAKARPAVEAVTGPDRVISHVRELPGGLEHTGADLTVAAFLLQFLPLADRLRVLSDARVCSSDSGALIIAEKTRAADSRWAEIAVDVSHDVKARQGISDRAIRAKARALRGVLRPLTLTDTMTLIQAAGWARPEVLFCWHSWAVLGAFARP